MGNFLPEKVLSAAEQDRLYQRCVRRTLASLRPSQRSISSLAPSSSSSSSSSSSPSSSPDRGAADSAPEMGGDRDAQGVVSCILFVLSGFKLVAHENIIKWELWMLELLNIIMFREDLPIRRAKISVEFSLFLSYRYGPQKCISVTCRDKILLIFGVS